MARYRPYPEYKDSGVEWLGVVPKHWTCKRLKFSVSLINEKVVAQDSELEYMGLEHIESWTGRRLDDDASCSDGIAARFVADDVLFGKLRPYLAKVYRTQHEGLVSTEALVIRVSDLVNPGYLRYYMLSKDFVSEVDSSTYGSKMPRASWDFIGNLPMMLPLLDEQNHIENFLDYKTEKIDALIAKKEALLEKLAEKRTALISHAVTKGLDPDVKMKDSGVEWLGQVPVHWRRMLLNRVVTKIEQGWSPLCDERLASLDEWGVLKSGCVNHGIFSEDEHKTLAEGIDPVVNLEVRSGDILMCRASGSKHLIGSVAKVDACRERLMFSDKTYRIILQPDRIDSDFFVFSMQSKYMRDQVELSISGADGLANNIPQASAKRYQMVVPPLCEQKLIVKFLRCVLQQLGEQKGKISEVVERLKEYRSALITQAVTGKIDVRDIDLPKSLSKGKAA